MKQKLLALHALFLRLLGWLAPVGALAIRLYLAKVFWASGMTKIESWDSTIALFENEYAVPFLPPEIAALMGTAVELGVPVFLTLGLGTRFAAIVLFVFNIVAVISYPDLTDVGREDHLQWGLLMLAPIFYGPGKIALDYWIGKYFTAKTTSA